MDHISEKRVRCAVGCGKSLGKYIWIRCLEWKRHTNWRRISIVGCLSVAPICRRSGSHVKEYRGLPKICRIRDVNRSFRGGMASLSYTGERVVFNYQSSRNNNITCGPNGYNDRCQFHRHKDQHRLKCGLKYVDDDYTDSANAVQVIW